MLACVLMLPGLASPWGRDLASINGGYYMLSEMRAFEASGYFELKGIPHLGLLPTVPPIGHPYVHHPPGWPAFLYAFTRLTGLTPTALRLLPAILTALSVGLLVGWMTRRGIWWPVSILVVATAPIISAYGAMPNPEASVQLILIAALFLDDLRRDGARRLNAVLLTLAAIGPWMDWQGAFLAPAILLREILKPRVERKWQLPIIISAVTTLSCVGVITWIGHASIHLDSIRILLLEGTKASSSAVPSVSLWDCLIEGISHARLISQGSATAPASTELGAWWSTIYTSFDTLIIWPFIPAVAVFAFTRHHGLIAALAIPGILNIALFRLHARQHDFWVIHLAPASAWIVASILNHLKSRIEGRWQGLGVVLVLGTALGLAAFRITQLSAHRARDTSEPNESLAQALATIQRKDVAFASTTPLGTASGYLRGFVIDLPPDRVPELVALTSRGHLSKDIDIITPDTTALDSLRALAPSTVSFVRLPLTLGEPKDNALRAWAGTDSLVRITIHTHRN